MSESVQSSQGPFFLLQALFVNSLHRLLSTLSFLDMTVWTFAQYMPAQIRYSFPLNVTVDILRSSTEGTGRNEGGKREVEKKDECSLSLHKFLHIN